MNLTRCNNGHFYDKDKFATCPHCQKLSGGDTDKTRPMRQTEDNSFGASFPGGDAVTMPQGMVSDDALTVPNRTDFQDIFAEGKLGRKDRLGSRSRMRDTEVATTDENEKTVGVYSFKGQKGSDDSSYFNENPVVGWLVCTKGASCGTSYTLKSGRNFIGRDRTMDVCLNGDKSVSRNCHAIIIFDPKSRKFMVQPGTSRELFYLNDKVVLGVEEISAYDIMTVGKTDLTFVPFCSDSFSWEDQMEKSKLQ